MSVDQERLELIKELIKARIRAQFCAPEVSAHLQSVDELSAFQLQGTIEASIIWIYERFAAFIAGGASEQQALKTIEMSREHLGKGEPPAPLTLIPYTMYRTKLEHDGSQPLPDGHVFLCLAASERFFHPELNRCRVASALSHAYHLEIAMKAAQWQKVSRAFGVEVRKLALEEITLDQFFDQVMPLMPEDLLE